MKLADWIISARLDEHGEWKCSVHYNVIDNFDVHSEKSVRYLVDFERSADPLSDISELLRRLSKELPK